MPPHLRDVVRCYESEEQARLKPCGTCGFFPDKYTLRHNLAHKFSSQAPFQRCLRDKEAKLITLILNVKMPQRASEASRTRRLDVNGDGQQSSSVSQILLELALR